MEAKLLSQCREEGAEQAELLSHCRREGQSRGGGASKRKLGE